MLLLSFGSLSIIKWLIVRCNDVVGPALLFVYIYKTGCSLNVWALGSCARFLDIVRLNCLLLSRFMCRGGSSGLCMPPVPNINANCSVNAQTCVLIIEEDSLVKCNVLFLGPSNRVCPDL